jgi:hypothetical protein
LHVGMIQHDPSGYPAFLHRTAEGKVYPFNHGYRKVRAPPRHAMLQRPCLERAAAAAMNSHARVETLECVRRTISQSR